VKLKPRNHHRVVALSSALACAVVSGFAQPAPAPELSLLTTAQQVLDLGLEVARQLPHPVCVQGMVTYYEPGTRTVYVQDHTGGLRVNFTNQFVPEFGQPVIVQGAAMAGQLTPVIDRADVRRLETPVAVEPVSASSERLAAGELSGQWVQLEGVVRDVTREANRAQLLMAAGGLRFRAEVQPFRGTNLPREWLEARVSLRGVAWTEVNAENQPVGFTLFVPGSEHVILLQSGSTNLFAQLSPLSSAAPELRRQSDRRLKVGGRVTYQSMSGNVFLEDGAGAVRARLLVALPRLNPDTEFIERPAQPALRPGEQVEVVGAPTTVLFAPAMQDAEVRRLGTGAPPAAVGVAVSDVLSGRYDGRLISLRARLLAQEIRQAGALRNQVLALQSGDTIFEAVREFTGTNAPVAPRNNTYVQVTGICAVQLGELSQVRSFRLLLRDDADVLVLGQPPWWEGLPLGRIAAVSFAFVAVPVIWIWLLRRQVAQRTAQLHEALAAERELSELRSRFVSMVSHEFRTPLGVILSAAENLDSYLDRLRPEQRRQQLEHIMQATRHMGNLMEEVLLLGRAEAGRLEFKAAPVDLAAFCGRIAGQVQSAMAEQCPIKVTARVDGRWLADENLLRHGLTNLLSNAVKYSPAGSPVEFSLTAAAGRVVFRVADRGIGIPAGDRKQLFTAFHRGQNVGQIPGSGLGLVIAQRCIELHGGEISCESREGAGTVFTVSVPMTLVAGGAPPGPVQA
jgi:signal transduction histidine kinase